MNDTSFAVREDEWASEDAAAGIAARVRSEANSIDERGANVLETREQIFSR